MPSNIFQRGFTSDESGAQLSDWKWIIDNGTRLLKDNNAENTTVTIYTVPAGKKFYMISASIFSSSENPGAEAEGEFKEQTAGSILRTVTQPGATSGGGISSSFTIPLVFDAGEVLQVSSSTTNYLVSVTFTGYEVDIGAT